MASELHTETAISIPGSTVRHDDQRKENLAAVEERSIDYVVSSPGTCCKLYAVNFAE